MTQPKRKKKTTKKTSTARKKTSAKKKSRSKKVSPIPEGYGAITASLRQKNPQGLIKFCQEAFGAKLKSSLEDGKGQIMHAQLKLGDSLLHVGAAPEDQSLISNLMLYVKNVDKVLEQALAAGGTVVMPIQDQFWGDRFVLIQDPFGNFWEIASRIEIVSMKELKKRTKQFMP